MPLHRATVNLPGLSFGQVADVTKKDAERWVEAGYLDPLTRDEAADIQVEQQPPPVVAASDAAQKGKG